LGLGNDAVFQQLIGKKKIVSNQRIYGFLDTPNELFPFSPTPIDTNSATRYV
jgi:hypothetical protein